MWSADAGATKDGATELTIKAELRNDNFADLDIAIITLVQRSNLDLSFIQTTAPARFLCERENAFKFNITEADYVRDVRAAFNLVKESKGKTFEKDSPEALELLNAQKMTRHALGDTSDWRRQYRELKGRYEQRIAHLTGNATTDTEIAAIVDRIPAVSQRLLTVFLCNTNLNNTFRNIAARQGNPAVIAMYGHGGVGELVAPDGSVNHIRGQMFAKALHESGLRPKLVLFINCCAHKVATDAHVYWSQNVKKSPCVFIGPTEETPQEDVFSGDCIPARFLELYWYSSLYMKLRGKDFSVTYSMGPNKTVAVKWTRTVGSRMTNAQLEQLFTLCLFDNYELDTNYFPGSIAVAEISAARETRKLMASDGSHHGWQDLAILCAEAEGAATEQDDRTTSKLKSDITASPSMQEPLLPREKAREREPTGKGGVDGGLP